MIKLQNNYKVYMHTSPHGKVYIGITSKAPNARWGKSGQNYKNNKHFWAAIQMYGWDNFSHDILFTGLSLEEASAKEIELIAIKKSDCPDFGYNIAPGGNVTKHSLATRKLLSERNRERWRNPDYKKKMSETMAAMWLDPEYRASHSGENAPMYGRRQSESSKKKISETRKARQYKYGGPKGWHWDDEHKQMMSEKMKHIWKHKVISEEERRKRSEAKMGARNPNYGKPMSEKCKKALHDVACKPVKQILNGEVVAVFQSSSDASNHTGIEASNINRCANGKRLTAGGYSWEFV